jgi:hypothetical protein
MWRRCLHLADQSPHALELVTSNQDVSPLGPRIENGNGTVLLRCDEPALFFGQVDWAHGSLDGMGLPVRQDTFRPGNLLVQYLFCTPIVNQSDGAAGSSS